MVAHREGGFPKAGLRASAPHNSVSPRRRLYQRAAHALGGVTGKLGGNLRGIEDAIKKPPARVSYGKQSTGLFSYFPALAGAIRPWDAVPHPASFLSRKLGKELYPPTARTCASGSHRRGVQPPSLGATCLGCNPRGLTAQALGVLIIKLLPPKRKPPEGIFPRRREKGAKNRARPHRTGPVFFSKFS